MHLHLTFFSSNQQMYHLFDPSVLQFYDIICVRQLRALTLLFECCYYTRIEIVLG